MLSLLVAFLDVALESTGVKWLQQLEAAQELRRDGHDGSPIIELSTILFGLLDLYPSQICEDTYIRSTEDSNEDPVVEELIAILYHHVRATN